MEPLLPSSFLPHLPRRQNTFEPLSPLDLLGHISILRDLYVPPIHGGLQASDTFCDSDSDDADPDQAGPSRGRRMSSKARRFSVGLVESMEGLGLSTGLAISQAMNGSANHFGDGRIEEEPDTPSGETDSEADQGHGGARDDAHLDPFEREWSQKWLEGVFRRAQTWIEEQVEEDDPGGPALNPENGIKVQMKEMEAILREATAVLAMMAGTSAAGSLTRHLLFPIDPKLGPAWKSLQTGMMHNNPNLSPETTSFLASLSTSPISPVALHKRTLSTSPVSPLAFHKRALSSSPVNHHNHRISSAQQIPTDSVGLSTSPTTTLGASFSPSRLIRRHRKRPAIPILLHDAPMSDHLSVGVQTWGSAILLGREMSLRPEKFGLVSPYKGEGVRVLELGAGTGLLSILCRKLLDLKVASSLQQRNSGGDNILEARGVVVATDFLPSVLDNLQICIDLNFPAAVARIVGGSDADHSDGIHVAELDWTSFPAYMQSRFAKEAIQPAVEAKEDMARFVDKPFDLVLASDCVYDPTHAELLRQVIGWVLRLPDPSIAGDIGGTFHILSPLRPTFTPELESIDIHFPVCSSYRPLSMRSDEEGEGIGRSRRLKIGVRGEGKRSAKGRKGEGRTDENLGYWWWEVGWG